MTNINNNVQVVTIAGSDSGGCAGIQADLKTFQARDVFGMNIVTAVTAQNTLGVQASLPIPNEFITKQFRSLADDFTIKAAKTGMLFDREHVECVVENLKKVDFGPLVVDPVMIAKGGHCLLKSEAIDTIRNNLLPLATVVTPNIPEAEVLAEMTIVSEKDMISAAKKIQNLGVQHVIIKGGHSTFEQAQDCVLFDVGKIMWLNSPRISTKNTHGTGDSFSSCIVAELAKGNQLREAIILAKQFIQGAIEQGIDIGRGHGPLNYWSTLSSKVIITE